MTTRMLRDWLGAGALACALIAAGTANAQTTLKVGGQRVSGDLPLFIAEKRGFFKEAGLNVELVRADGPQMIPALTAGKLDIVFVNTISAILANAHGFDLVVVAPAQEAYASGLEPASVWVNANSTLKGPKDLSGKTIAVNGLNNINWLYAREWLERNGVAPTSVRFREINFPQMPDALANNQIDAAYGTEPWQTSLLGSGAIRVIGSPFTEVQPGVPIALYVAARAWAAANERAARSFVQAIAKAVKFVEEDPATARRLWAERDSRPPESTQKTPLFTFSSKVDPAQVDKVVALMKKHQLLKPEVSLSAAGFVMPYATLK